MSDDISPERQKEMIEQAAQYIVSHDLEDMAIIALEGTAPFGTVVGELGIMMSYPLAVTFFNNFGADFVKMFGFNYQENAESLIKRIEELVEEKRREELKRKELERELGNNNDGWLSRIRSWFRG